MMYHMKILQNQKKNVKKKNQYIMFFNEQMNS